jgi:hypothetical protein
MLLEVNSLDSLLEESIEDMMNLWVQMQKLHDSNRYWMMDLVRLEKLC